MKWRRKRWAKKILEGRILGGLSAPRGLRPPPEDICEQKKARQVDTGVAACITAQIPEAIPGFFIGVGGLRKKNPVAPDLIRGKDNALHV